MGCLMEGDFLLVILDLLDLLVLLDFLDYLVLLILLVLLCGNIFFTGGRHCIR